MQDYRKLIAWQRAHGMTLAVHQVVGRRTRGGLPGLSSQVLRSAAATAANIAEGCGHRNSGELARFLDIAIASVVELDDHLLLAWNFGMLTGEQYDTLASEARDVRQLMIALVRRVRMPDERCESRVSRRAPCVSRPGRTLGSQGSDMPVWRATRDAPRTTHNSSSQREQARGAHILF
jgi:four helix bundle protein